MKETTSGLKIDLTLTTGCPEQGTPERSKEVRSILAAHHIRSLTYFMRAAFRGSEATEDVLTLPLLEGQEVQNRTLDMIGLIDAFASVVEENIPNAVEVGDYNSSKTTGSESP